MTIDAVGVLARLTFSAALGALALVGFEPAEAADHGDTPTLNAIDRRDAELTDLHVFVERGNLVILLSTNPAIPPHQLSYRLMPDVQFEVRIDSDSAVSFEDEFEFRHYGGTVLDPRAIKHDVEFKVVADEAGAPKLHVKGVAAARVSFRAGVFDDPFIRGPREGRNVYGMSFQVPLGDALRRSSTILVWAVAELNGVQVELGARALRSQVAASDLLNVLPPSQHEKKLGLAPDVVIFDTSRPAAFPNGRALEDDVVDLVALLGAGEQDLRASDGPSFPSTNDVSFDRSFPYYGAPHP